MFYEWLLAELSEKEKETFCQILDKLYLRSKKERRAGFVNIAKLVGEEEESARISEEMQE